MLTDEQKQAIKDVVYKIEISGDDMESYVEEDGDAYWDEDEEISLQCEQFLKDFWDDCEEANLIDAKGDLVCEEQEVIDFVNLLDQNYRYKTNFPETHYTVK